jgi:putative ABC transport system permease protein
VLGVGAGSVAAWLVVTRSMSLPFTWQAGPALLTVFGGLVFTVILGLIGTYSALGHKPAPVLRNL